VVDPAERAERYSKASREQWEELVALVLDHGFNQKKLAKRLGGLSKQSAANLQRKCSAISWCAAYGMSSADIIEKGQHATLGLFQRARQRNEPRQTLRFVVNTSLAEAVRTLIRRLMEVCDLETSDDLWDFIVSSYADMPDEALRQLAGMDDAQKHQAQR
jgi:hypothetical protein